MALMEQAEGGAGDTAVCYCMAAALAGLILDEEAMQTVVQRQEAAPLFENCVALLARTLDSLDSPEGQVTHFHIRCFTLTSDAVRLCCTAEA